MEGRIACEEKESKNHNVTPGSSRSDHSSAADDATVVAEGDRASLRGVSLDSFHGLDGLPVCFSIENHSGEDHRAATAGDESPEPHRKSDPTLATPDVPSVSLPARFSLVAIALVVALFRKPKRVPSALCSSSC